MSNVQQQYLVKTEIPVERIPDGMRLLSRNEVKFNMSKKLAGDFYRIYDGETSHTGGWDGDCNEYTYFTDKQYPIWERPQFLGNKLVAGKFYGGIHKNGRKTLIMKVSLFSPSYRSIDLENSFTQANSYGNDGSLESIREFHKIYEFYSLLDLAKWAEQKD